MTLLRRFFHDSRGAISTEAVLILPLLIWAYLAMFVFWDAFRAQNTNIKATYAIADFVSRETAAIRTADITGLARVHRYINATSAPTWIRITSVRYRAQDNSYRVIWSRSDKASQAPLNNQTVVALRPSLPVMSDGDTVVIVETWRAFTPAFAMGLEAHTFRHLSVTRPRFIDEVPFS